jgi:hypothetical protein
MWKTTSSRMPRAARSSGSPVQAKYFSNYSAAECASDLAAYAGAANCAVSASSTADRDRPGQDCDRKVFGLKPQDSTLPEVLIGPWSV